MLSAKQSITYISPRKAPVALVQCLHPSCFALTPHAFAKALPNRIEHKGAGDAQATRTDCSTKMTACKQVRKLQQ